MAVSIPPTDTTMRHEDEVRDAAKTSLGLFPVPGVKAGAGQITTFNRLGFPGISDKPDGWWLPDDPSQIALILEAKAESVDIDTKKCTDEIRKNCSIAMNRYDRVVGILHSEAFDQRLDRGAVRVFRGLSRGVGLGNGRDVGGEDRLGVCAHGGWGWVGDGPTTTGKEGQAYVCHRAHHRPASPPREKTG